MSTYQIMLMDVAFEFEGEVVRLSSSKASDSIANQAWRETIFKGARFFCYSLYAYVEMEERYDGRKKMNLPFLKNGGRAGMKIGEINETRKRRQTRFRIEKKEEFHFQNIPFPQWRPFKEIALYREEKS